MITKLSAVRAGDRFEVFNVFGKSESGLVRQAKSSALACSRGYVRVETANGVVNLHGSTKVRIFEASRDQKCRWFLLCPNPATTAVAHPILGDVPCCAKCAAFASSK